jgi:hypothetical protein
MNKAQRKRRAQEIKRKAKEARRARHTNPPVQAQAAPTPNDAAPAHAEAAQAPQTSAPHVHSVEDEVHMAYGKMYRAEAEVVEGAIAEKLGDDEAAGILARAARSLEGVIRYAESVLKRLPAEQVAEALRLKEEPRRHGEKSRRGTNAGLQILNVLLRAKSLLVRVIRQTNPDLAKRLKSV